MERSAEIEALVTDWFHAMGKGDLAAIDALIGTGDVRFIGTDAAEWWGPDRAAVSRVMTTQVAETQGKVLYDPLYVEGYRDGAVGWAAAMPRITLPDATTLDARLSAVFHEEAPGQWRVVQAHLSIGVPNEEALGQELTTG